ncbi:MAG TPA: hypothetical protein VNN80_27015 [Polyangiaceae bacterium]|nr:hypothetical protein [Polyangiaceae bacterium]
MSAALALLGSCSTAASPQVEIAAHYVPACAPLPEAAPSRLELSALGDFEPSNDSVAILQSDASNQPVLLPEGTQAAELSALDGDSYWGSGALDAYNHIPILLWPERRGCELAQFETGLPSAGAWLAGASERLATLLALGPGASGAESYRVDLSSGLVERLAPGSAPRQSRQAATLSELGDQLLLAGGVDAGSGRVLDNGEPFDPATGRFTGDTVALARPRARHAAVSLPGGSSLLIGGVSEAGEALRSVEVVSPGSGRVARAYDLLGTARVAPRAVLLGQERVLVGGGYEPGAAGARTPVASVELLHTDLSLATDPPVVLAPAAFDRAFAPLGPGSALAVGGCEPSSAPPADCAACDGGCVSRAVFWIDSRGAAYELEPLPSALAVAAPELVPGANGSPWLIAGARLGRFDPWRGRFELVDAGLPELGSGLGAALAVRPGLFAWIAAAPAGVALVGLYHSQRGPWARDVAPLLVGSAAGMVPDRPPGANDGGVQLDYAAATGLELAGPEALVSIADAEYADFTLELALADGPPPLLRLIGARGDAAAFGGIECPWPDAPALAVPARLRVRRSTDQVQLERLDAAGSSSAAVDACVRPLPARVGLQLLGTRDGVSRVTRIEVRRALD